MPNAKNLQKQCLTLLSKKVAPSKTDPTMEVHGLSMIRAMKVDRFARIIVPVIFLIECTILMTLGLTHDEEIKEKPGYKIHYLESVKLTL